MDDHCSTPTIRDARAADLDTIVEFNRLLAEETEAKRLEPAVLRGGVARLLGEPALGRYFVAEDAGHVIGQAMITYEWSDWRCGTFWWLQSVYVAREHRGRGVFRALFEHVAALARATPDVCGLRLYVEHRNDAALATYGRLGMVPSGHRVYEIDWSGKQEG